MSKNANCALKTMFLTNVRKAMRAKNATNRELASFMRVHPVTISRWLHGVNEIPLNRIGEMATFLSVKPYTLFKSHTPKMVYDLDDKICGIVFRCKGVRVYADDFHDKHSRAPTFRDILELAHYNPKDPYDRFPIIIAETPMEGDVYRCFAHDEYQIDLVGHTDGYV